MTKTTQTRERSPRVVAVVEDNADLRESFAEYLESQGLTVVRAANGVEALVQIKRRRPASVVVDLLMPRLGGLETLKWIKAFDPAIRVVVVTGAEDPALRRQALALGASAVLRKPVTPEMLFSVLIETPPSGSRGTDSSLAVATTPTTTTPGRVLVVDDEADVRALLEDFLTQQGYHVRSVPDGAAALRQMADAAPDLVLLDIDMPWLNGVDTLAIIRGLAPHVKVVMISGKASLETAKKSLASGAFDYISKPFDLDHLNEVVAAAFVWEAP